MIIIRISDSEIVISGNREDMCNVEHAIIGLISDEQAHSFEVTADVTCDPKPYDRLLSSMYVDKSGEAILARVDNDRLVISASTKNLDVLSSYFSFSEEEPEGSHNHCDYFDGDIYVHRQSRSFVVMLRT